MTLWEMLHFPILQQALWISILLGISCALLSCFLVLKGWALLADAIAHAILFGVALAHLLGLPMMLGAAGAGFSCALGTAWLEQRSILRSDTLLGIVFSTLFALGILLSESAQHLSHLLLGHLLGMNAAQRWQVTGVCFMILTFIALQWRNLLLFTFDSTQAQLSGLRIQRLSMLLVFMITLMTVAAMQAVGVILVVAMLIAPAVSAQLVVKRFGHLMLLSCTLSVLASVGGVLLSFKWNSSVSATIVLLQALLFLLMLLLRHILQHSRTLYWSR